MKTQLAFIDWMKAVGMMLIVYGHAPAGGLIRFTEPFNPKQLGVAFFVFVSGYTLALENRPTRRVLFNRLFDIVFWGLACAIVYSIVSLIVLGDLAESNYLPFALGANVLTNAFPANPTTWYIGTYMHLLLLWALFLRGVTIRGWMVAAALAVEILSRGALLAVGWGLTAYMQVGSWLTIFLLGMRAAQLGRGAQPQPWDGRSRTAAAVWLVLLCAWALLGGRIPVIKDFPFYRLQVAGETVDALLTAALVATLYQGYTRLFFALAARMPNLSGVRFLARNTLLVFILHMPLVWSISPHLNPLIPWAPVRVVVNLLLYYFLLSLLSEGLQRVMPVAELKQRVWRLIGGKEPASQGEGIARAV